MCSPTLASPDTEPLMIESRHLRTYLDTFVHRPDLYARQTSKGSYFIVRNPVSEDVIRAHLEGASTAGFYALKLDNTTRWVVLDADQDEGRERLQEDWKQLTARGISAQLELSRRGGHLWVLLEPMAAHVARRVIFGALPDLGPTEVFPKQDRLETRARVGSLMRGPLGIHRLTGQRYPFVDPISLKPVCTSIVATIDHLAEAPRITTAQAAELLAALLDEAKLPPAGPAAPLTPDGKLPGRRSVIQEINERIGDLYAFVAQYVDLDDAGRGSCPFHPPDEHPSFAVDRQRGFWTCFHEINPKTGRYVGGDAVEFYRRLKGLPLNAAVQELRGLLIETPRSRATLPGQPENRFR